MHKVSHIILAVLLVWSSSGLPLARHYCMGMLKGTGWYGAEICNHELADEKGDRDKETFSTIPCCDEVTDWLQTDETIVHRDNLDIGPQAEILPPVRLAEVNPEAQKVNLGGNRGPPDSQHGEMLVLLQVFRI